MKYTTSKLTAVLGTCCVDACRVGPCRVGICSVGACRLGLAVLGRAVSGLAVLGSYGAFAVWVVFLILSSENPLASKHVDVAGLRRNLMNLPNV